VSNRTGSRPSEHAKAADRAEIIDTIFSRVRLSAETARSFAAVRHFSQNKLLHDLCSLPAENHYSIRH
jgi:hypothetical protein